MRVDDSYLEDLETRHIEDADEGGALALGAVERAVDAVDQPAEHALVASLGDGLHSKLHLGTTRVSYLLPQNPLVHTIDFLYSDNYGGQIILILGSPYVHK